MSWLYREAGDLGACRRWADRARRRRVRRDEIIVHGWRELAAAPQAVLDDWGRRHLDDLAAAETRWLAAADGKTLVHGD
ncbi:MAG TPA: hypothetical protein VMV07_17740, partial [Streptosporangiaceae bacterium]|nr:hypothetical protein [Streptosporangiaceae bacterium]